MAGIHWTSGRPVEPAVSKRGASYVFGPVPKCSKLHSWTDRLDARAELLRRWALKDFRPNGTHWCVDHQAYHLTSHAKNNGSNYSYRD